MKRGGGGGAQVAVDDILDRHVIGAVHEMVAAHHAVSLLTHVPGTKTPVVRRRQRVRRVCGSKDTHISKCVKKSTSSLVVNGTSAPTVPRMPP